MQVALSGLAPDGGLFLPNSFDAINTDRLVQLNFIDRACRILEDLLPRQIFPNFVIEEIVNKAYKDFPVEGTPIVRINDQLVVAELFHGPSGSFKGTI